MEQEIRRPLTAKGKRVLEDRASKLIENDKKVLLIRGQTANDVVKKILKDFYDLKKPEATLFWKKNVMYPFEDTSSLEFLTLKNDSSLFAFASNSKKRPNNLVIGRMHDFQVLDMIELGVVKYTSMQDIRGSKCLLASKPCLLFSGTAFDTEDELRRLKSVFIDFFRGAVVENVRLNGLEHVLHFTATDNEVFMRGYKIVLKKSGTRTPRIELEDMGPNIDFVLRRTRLASAESYKEACKKPKGGKPKKIKNVSSDVLGTKHGRVHMQSQDLNTLQLKKRKALKRKFDVDAPDNDKDLEFVSDNEEQGSS